MNRTNSETRRQSDLGADITFTIGEREIELDTALMWAGLGIMLILPFTTEPYYLDLIVKAYIFAIFAIGVDILWGYTGVLTFGHAAFFGFGAYIMAKTLNASLFVGGSYFGLLIAFLAPAFLGLIIAGILFYRGISESYFTIITLAIAVIAKQIAISWQSVTGGFNGLTGIPPFQIGIPFVAMTSLEEIPFYYLILVLLLLSYLFARRLVSSSFGTALVAIKENETKARALGYSIPKYKTLSFAIASGMAGFAGALYAGQSGLVSPGDIGFLLSTQVLLWVLIGGRGTLIGPILGALFLVLFQDFISSLLVTGWTLILGIVLVVIVLALPGGLMQLGEMAKTRFIRE